MTGNGSFCLVAQLVTLTSTARSNIYYPIRLLLNNLINHTSESWSYFFATFDFAPSASDIFSFFFFVWDFPPDLSPFDKTFIRGRRCTQKTKNSENGLSMMSIYFYSECFSVFHWWKRSRRGYVLVLFGFFISTSQNGVRVISFVRTGKVFTFVCKINHFHPFRAEGCSVPEWFKLLIRLLLLFDQMEQVPFIREQVANFLLFIRRLMTVRSRYEILCCPWPLYNDWILATLCDTVGWLHLTQLYRYW